MRYQVPLRGDKEIKKKKTTSVQLVRQTNNYKGGRVCLIDFRGLLPFTLAKTYISRRLVRTFQHLTCGDLIILKETVKS